jgi:hypothetical protein
MWKRKLWKQVLSALLISVILLLGVSSIVTADSWVNVSVLASRYVTAMTEHIVKTPDGTYWVSYVVEATTEDELYVSSSADGVTWSSPALLDTANISDLNIMGMAAQTTGYVTVVYATNNGTDGIHSIVYDGASWGSPELVVAIWVANVQNHASVTVDSNDHIHLFYEDDTGGSSSPDLYHTWEDGGSWESPELIAAYTGYNISGTDIVASSSKIYFFWGSSVAPGGVAYNINMRTKIGSTLSGATILYTTGSGYDYLSAPVASIWTNGDDVLLAFSAELTGEDYNDIAVTYSTDGGMTWAWVTYVERIPLGPKAPFMAINNKGVVTITWLTDDNNCYYATNSEGYQANVIDYGVADSIFHGIETLDGYYPRVNGKSVSRSDAGLDIVVNDAVGGYSDVLYRHVTTLSNLFVVTKDATNIGLTTATLNGELSTLSGSAYASVYFQYGVTTAYGTNTTYQQLTAIGTFGQALTGLTNYTTYHYRAVATAGGVTVYGVDKIFTTGIATILNIKSAKVFSDYKVAGDYLVVTEAQCNYINISPTESPGNYFQMQLLGTDGTTILAAVPLMNWGDRPISIYINPTMAAGLTYGSGYYVRIYGTYIAGNPSTSYQLQNTATNKDWKGSDLALLDMWCIGTALNMQSTDGETGYVTNMHNRTVISDQDAVYFKRGIPGIDTERPNLFETQSLDTTITAGTSSNTWDSANAWETNVGTSIKDDANIFGVPFGITGKNFLSGGIIAAMLGCAAFVVSRTSGFGALGAVLIAIPLLWAGVWFRIVPIMVIIVIVIIFAFFAVRQFFIKAL